MPLRQHPLMKDARDENTFRFRIVEDHMPAVLMSAEAGTNLIRRTTDGRINGKHFTTFFKCVQVAKGLGFTPGLKRVVSNTEQVCLGLARKTKLCHGLPQGLGELKFLPYSSEDVARRNTACVGFVDR